MAKGLIGRMEVKRAFCPGDLAWAARTTRLYRPVGQGEEGYQIWKDLEGLAPQARSLEVRAEPGGLGKSKHLRKALLVR